MSADMHDQSPGLAADQHTDQVLHCAWLYGVAEVMIRGDVQLDRDAMARVGRQLVDYAALLEHADRAGWWDR